MAVAVAPELTAALGALVGEAAASGGEMAVCLRHLERGEAFDHLPDAAFVAASTIKVPVLVALYDAAARGRVDLDARVRLRPGDQVTGSGVLQLLTPGVRLSLRDLAELMIVVSDNAATNMILDRVGIAETNACLDTLGLHTTRVHRGLQIIPAGATAFNTVTAGELATLLRCIAQGKAVSWEASRRMVATLKRQQVRQALPALLPDPEDADGAAVGAVPAWELAHKTGSIPGLEHDVGILYLPGQTVVTCVLTRGCGAGRAARELIARVGRAVWSHYTGIR
jgi:beta-lactamase class A